MDRILAPRGDGRTYQVCKYAIEHDCDIIVPTATNIRTCQNTLKKICNDSDGTYKLRAEGGRGSIMTSGVGFLAVTIDIAERPTVTIKIYTSNGYLHSPHQLSGRDIIADDADECLRSIIGPRLKACSIATYDPADVILKQPVLSDSECVCSSLL